MGDELRRLIGRASRCFETAQLRRIVRPVVQILYFGDLEGYMRSDVQIITVGLNPTSAELPTDDSLFMFSASRPLVRGAQRDTPHRCPTQ